jgi:hypothetical protein
MVRYGESAEEAARLVRSFGAYTDDRGTRKLPSFPSALCPADRGESQRRTSVVTTFQQAGSNCDRNEWAFEISIPGGFHGSTNIGCKLCADAFSRCDCGGSGAIVERTRAATGSSRLGARRRKPVARNSRETIRSEADEGSVTMKPPSFFGWYHILRTVISGRYSKPLGMPCGWRVDPNQRRVAACEMDVAVAGRIAVAATHPG